MGCSCSKAQQDGHERVPNGKLATPPGGTQKTESRQNNQQYIETLEYLSRVPLLRYMPKEQRPVLASSCSTETFMAGDVVIRQGEIGHEFFLVKEGEAHVFVESLDGKSMKIATVTAGDYFGEHALLLDEPRNATIKAVTDLHCLKICGDSFRDLGLHKQLAFVKRLAVYDNVVEDPVQQGNLAKGPEEKAFIINAVMQNQHCKTLGMNEERAGKLAETAWLEEVKAGQEIISQGDDQAKYFYVVASGAFDVFVNLSMETAEPTSVHVGGDKVQNIGPGGSFGELALVHATKRAATVRSTVQSSVWVMGRAQFKRALANDDVASEYEELLGHISIFAALLKSERRAVANAMTEIHFKENDIVQQQGERSDTFHVLCEGEVALIKDGQEVSKLCASKSSKRPHHFGERGLVNNQSNLVTVKVTSPGARALALGKAQFNLLLESVREQLDTTTGVRRATLRLDGGAPAQLDSVEMEDLRLVGILGTGAFGRVELHEHVSTGKTFAVKVLSKGYIVKMRMKLNIVNEKYILENVSSPFIVRLYKTSSTAQALFFVLEACLGGEVFTLYERKHLHGHEYPAKYFSASVALAFEHLHERFVIYRDLKPENLLLDSAGHMKLTDMGLAKFVMGKTYTTCGTPEYFAPEVIQMSGQTRALDWWTLGILIYELMTGGTPFWAGTTLEMYEKVLEGIDKAAFPAKAKGLPKQMIKSLVQFDPAKRLGGIARIKTHPWFKNFEWEALISETLRPPYIPSVKGNKDLQNFASKHQEINWAQYQDDGSGWDACF